MNNIYYRDESAPIYISYEVQDGYVSMPKNHFHNAYEIYYMLSGEKNIFIKDRTHHVRKGDLVFINIHDLHRTMNAGVQICERVLFNFRPEFIKTFSSSNLEPLLIPFTHSNGHISLPVKEQAFVEDLLFKTLNEVKNNATGAEEMIMSYLVRLLVFSARFIERNSVTLNKPIKEAQSNVEAIIYFINANYMEPLTLTLISERFFISPFYLCKIFKEYTGFTMVEYLNQIRIIKAQKLLSENRCSILDISGKVGFGSVSHFGRVFKAITGTSPLNYRKSSN